MQPAKYDFTGGGVAPLNTYGNIGVSWSAEGVVVTQILADKSNTASIIAAPTDNFIDYPADGLLVTGTGTLTVLQYGG
jgi:hypothetical protein